MLHAATEDGRAHIIGDQTIGHAATTNVHRAYGVLMRAVDVVVSNKPNLSANITTGPGRLCLVV